MNTNTDTNTDIGTVWFNSYIGLVAATTGLSPADIRRASHATELFFHGLSDGMLGKVEREALAASEALCDMLLAGEQTRATADDECGPEWYVDTSTTTEQLLRQIKTVEDAVARRNVIWRVGGYGKRKFAR